MRKGGGGEGERDGEDESVRGWRNDTGEGFISVFLFCYLLVWFTKRPFSKLEKPEHEGNYFLF